MLAKFAIMAAMSGAVTLAVAVGLVLSQSPKGTVEGEGLDFTGILRHTMKPTKEPRHVPMRDGYDLVVREYGAQTQGPLIVMVHGSGWTGLQFTGLAQSLRTRARVLVPDLRGHGAAPGRRGDVDHIGQLEEDLADLIAAEKQPGQKVLLLGHSSGGGLVVRMSAGPYGGELDGAFLLAPFLKYNAPTTRANSGGWARPLTRRIIGLSLLNAVGIRALNGLPVIEFNMPKAVLNGPLGKLGTTQYSYRLNVSYAPRSDYLNDIRHLPAFLLLAGDQDEAFVAEAYQPLMAAETGNGQYQVVPGTGHLDIVDAPQTLAAIKGFLDGI